MFTLLLHRLFVAVSSVIDLLAIIKCMISVLKEAAALLIYSNSCGLFFVILIFKLRLRNSVVVKVLYYKLEGHGFET
jgi:hypothetical protein